MIVRKRLFTQCAWAVIGLAFAAPGLAQDKLDFSVGGLKWRCQYNCGKVKAAPISKIEQSGSTVTLTDTKGIAVTGAAKTEVRAPVASQGPSLRCQMNPKFCGNEPAPKTTYYRSIHIPDWRCSVSVQEKNGEPNTPPPFKAKWLRFAGPECAMGTSTWTTLSANEVKAMEKRCGEWNENC